MKSSSVKRSFSFAQAFQFTSQPVCLITALYVLPASVFKQGTIDFQCLALLYFASFFIYNADRLWGYSPEDTLNHPERSAWIEQYKSALSFLCISAGLITFYISLSMTPTQQILIALCGVPSILYILPKLSWRGKSFRWRELPATKELSVAFAWSLAVTALPLAHHPSHLVHRVSTIYLILVFIAALCNVLLCDLHDRHGDRHFKVYALANHKPQLAQKLCSSFAFCGLLITLLMLQQHILFFGFIPSFVALALLAKQSSFNKLYTDLALLGPILFSLFLLN